MLRRIVLSLLSLAALGGLFAIGALAQPGTSARINTDSQPVVLHLNGTLPTLENAVPGSARESTLTVANSGRSAGALHLDLRANASPAVRAEFELILRSGGRVSYHGPLAAHLFLPLGKIAPGERVRYQVQVRMRRSARLQGGHVGLSATLDASQTS